jgi:hypothetical protein
MMVKYAARNKRKEISSRVLFAARNKPANVSNNKRRSNSEEKKLNHVKLRVKLPSKVFCESILV